MNKLVTSAGVDLYLSVYRYFKLFARKNRTDCDPNGIKWNEMFLVLPIFNGAETLNNINGLLMKRLSSILLFTQIDSHF